MVMAAGGYPGKYEKGKEIKGFDQVPAGVEVFHAGTARREGKVVTAGGRVLGVTATGRDIPEAITLVYQGVAALHFEGAHYRKDIGQKAINRS